MTAVAVGRRARRSDREAPGGIGPGLAQGACPLDIVEHREPPSSWRPRRGAGPELPAVADLAVPLAIDLEVDQDIFTRACSSPTRFHQPLLEVPLCLLQPGRPELAVNGRAVHPCRRHQGLEPDAA